MINTRTLIFLIFYCITLLTKAQELVKKIVVDKYYQPIPFYLHSQENKDYLSNSIGEIYVTPIAQNSIDSLITNNVNDTILVNNYSPTVKLSFTSYEELLKIKSLCKESKNINLKSLGPFKYTAYNKFFISSKELNKGVNWFNDKVLSRFKYKVEKSDDARHMVLSESISEREYIDPLHEKEVVKWSKLSGVDKALFFSLNSQLQTTDIYDKKIKILTAKFVNPFNREATLGYHYSFTDTITQGNKKLVKVNFFPKRLSRFESIKGFAWLSLEDNAILYFYAEPYHTRKMKSSYSIEFNEKNGKIIPNKVRTTLFLDNVSSSNITITANQITYITDFESAPEITKSKFSDLALTYSDESSEDIKTPTPLTKADSNTYKYFSNGKNVKINRVLKWGENLYFGKVYTKYVNIDLPKLITYNRYEKLRLGLALSSNDKLSKTIETHGRLAYGFGDKDWKYETGANVKILDNHKLELRTSYSDDIIEAGLLETSLVERFNNSEILRQFQLKLFDRQQKLSVQVRAKPLKYITTQLGVNIFKDTPLYNYSYKGFNNFNIKELNFNIRYAFGERYFRFYDERISFKSKYPVFWLHVDQSLGDSNIKYSRAQLRARYTHDFIINGTTKIELLAGNYSGELPYFKLFNGQGSAELKSTIRGAFETMNYNEFTADKYAILFLSHDFGYFNVTKNKTFRPKIEVGFNYGLGKLSTPEDHEELELKGFEKGYGEAGLAINDLILFYPGGIKIGLGVSFYHRLSYRYPSFGANSILKLSLGFVV